ncbi:MAG: hypothetical protein ACJAUY_000640 [Cognaticolwellia sp.]|jgi:hypothetical protein
MTERVILKAISDVYPKASSIKKLTVATGKARNEVDELVDGLKKLQLINTTNKGEVYLLKDGKLEMGVYEPSERAKSDEEVKLNAKLSAENSNMKDSVKCDIALAEKSFARTVAPFVTHVEKTALNSNKPNLAAVTNAAKSPVFDQLKELEQKLSSPAIIIDDLTIKSAVLVQLSNILALDIGELLLEINEDLLKLSGEPSLPGSAA